SRPIPRPPISTLFPYTTLFRSALLERLEARGAITVELEADDIKIVLADIDRQPSAPVVGHPVVLNEAPLHEIAHPIGPRAEDRLDRKSTRLNSSHVKISYAVFC